MSNCGKRHMDAAIVQSGAEHCPARWFKVLIVPGHP
jgi:hypothetical protein